MIGLTQFWKVHAGGTYVTWYYPLLLVAVFGAASAAASLGLVFSGDSDGSAIAKTIDGSFLE